MKWKVITTYTANYMKTTITGMVFLTLLTLRVESQNCSIRPVWLMLQQRIDDALESVRLADLLQDEPTVRARVGLPVLQH